MTDFDTHEFDVIVIGAGGAGLRAAIEAASSGMKTALICKSLLGKAHTVMAEGGMAAALGNVDRGDNWQVHFGDTIRGGKYMGNWRMQQLHAQEFYAFQPAHFLRCDHCANHFTQFHWNLTLRLHSHQSVCVP